MLTEQSYALAMGAYLAAALVGLGLIYRYWMRVLPVVLRRLLLGLFAALLLTPAYPGPEAVTLAPALVVAAFNGVFGEGWPSAVPALALLLIASLAGMVLGLGSGLFSRGKARRREAAATETETA